MYYRNPGIDPEKDTRGPFLRVSRKPEEKFPTGGILRAEQEIWVDTTSVVAVHRIGTTVTLYLSGSGLLSFEDPSLRVPEQVMYHHRNHYDIPGDDDADI